MERDENMPITRRKVMQSLIASAVTASVSPRMDGQTKSNSQVDRYVTLPGLLKRPHLYLNPQSLQLQKERFHIDSKWASELLAKADGLVAEQFIPESVAEEGGGQQARYGLPARQISAMGLTLGLAYQITREEKYARKLHDAMSHYGQYVRWGGPGLVDRNPPWHSELDTAEFCLGFGCGYDMLHSYLSEEQRRQVSSDLIRLGITPTLDDWLLPPKRFHSLDSMGHNWWGICVAGAGIASLALLGDEPRAKDWVKQIDIGCLEWFAYAGNSLHNRFETFDAGNPSYEGVHYTGYGLSGYLRYLLAWKNIFPGKQAGTEGHLKGVSEFFLHTTYPASSGSIPVNFDDCRFDDDQTETVLLLQACGIENEYSRAYLQHSVGRMDDQFSFYFPVLEKRPLKAPLPLSKVYPKMGWAMVRSSWEENSTLLAIKSGYTWNHAHADASTFMLMHAGSRLLIDSGTCSYGNPKYNTYYRQSEAHNVVLFDGEGQPSETVDLGTKFPGSILKWFDGCGLRLIVADATGPMCHLFSRNYRSFLWIDNCILIIDDIATYRDGKLDWLLHTSGSSRDNGQNNLLIREGAASIGFSMVYPAVTVDVRKGFAPQKPEQDMPYYAFSAKTDKRRQRFISAMDLNPSDPVRLIVKATEHYLEITIDQAGERNLVYVNLRSIDGPYNMSSTIDINGWTTDAYILATKVSSGATLGDPADVTRYLVVDGSFVRYGSQIVCESLSKGDFLWKAGEEMEVLSRTQTVVSLKLYTHLSPHRVVWNGEQRTPSYDPQRRLIYLGTK
jgi:hypothetical protein